MELFERFGLASQEEGIVTKIRKSLALWYTDGQKINEPAVDVSLINLVEGHCDQNMSGFGFGITQRKCV